MWKYKMQSLSGIFGLAFGLACFVPAVYWMRYETSYDSFYPDAEHIYRVYAVEKQSGKVNEGVSRIFEKKLQEKFPAVEASTVYLIEQENCSVEGIPHVQLRTLYTDSTFFGIFPQEFVSGDSRQPLQVLNNIILTETVAVRLFGNAEKAIGQQVQTKMKSSLPPYTVTAVVKDPPANTNMQFDVIIYHDMIKYFSELPEEAQWTMFFMNLYVKLHPETDVDKLAEQMHDFTSRLGVNTNIELRMLPISDVRHQLNTDVPFTLNFIGLFVASGILLLFSALFNFLNLHLDLFRQRIRELRLRSVHGASEGQIVRQMMFELLCSILLALFLACSFVEIIRPAFAGLLNITMELSQLIQIFVVCGIGLMALILFIGFILFWKLSRLSTSPQLEIRITGKPVLRRMAVTMQLSVSMVFIVAALVVMMQMHFVNQKDLGFDSRGVIQLSGFLDYSGKIQGALERELATIPQIESITQADFEPRHKSDIYTMITDVEWPGKSSFETPAFNVIYTDSRFVETFKLKMVTGEWWHQGETQEIVLNEEAVREMGLSEPEGSIIRIPSIDDASVMVEYKVVGVVNDFHTLSLRNRIQPVIFLPSSQASNILYIRVVPGQDQEVMQKIAAILPGIDATLADARLTPVDELYNHLNWSEQVGLKMFSVLATVCMLISLFGIYAVAAAATSRRRKEIAIRKVVGAEAGNIIRMFLREYTLQVIAAGVVALPLAYLVMSGWLQGYAYRMNIPWWLLGGVIVGVIILILLTVFMQVLKAADSNPSEVIKA
ncbi:MAG: ABC transporter permease [Parabacteroides sp.]|uniref:ABC transporter permease n=1 Tax=Macellibacteroides sp. TaxID=2014584 RepID=UPI002A0CD27B|nr:ABC transporter permease [Parabacteroides sp.]